MIHSQRGSRAVSDIIGSLLMVAIVFILAFTVGNFVLGQYQEAKNPVSATVDFESNDDDTVDVVWTGKESADEIIIDNGTDSNTVITEFGEAKTVRFGPDGQDISVYANANPGKRTFLTTFSPPSYESTGTFNYVVAKSSSCDSKCGATIYFNGTELETDTGVNILLYDEDGAFVSYSQYNTDTNDKYRPPTTTLTESGVPKRNDKESCGNEGCQDKALKFLQQEVEEGNYILIVGHGQPGKIGPALTAEYERMGAKFSGDDELEKNDSWIIASKKTADSNPDEYELIFERHAPRMTQTGVKDVTAYFVPHFH